jgi:transcriptional regulator with XRE-family HTH domain
MSTSFPLTVLPRLVGALEQLGITQSELSRQTGISQSQISRILAGRGHRASKAYQNLCIYAFSSTGQLSNGALKPMSPELQEAIASVWDGTEVHAHALSAVIRSLDAFRFAEKGSQ